jgi:hypothetical protein
MDVVQRPSKSVYDARHRYTIVIHSNVASSPLHLYNLILSIQTHDGWSHPSCSPRHFNRLIANTRSRRPWSMGDYFRQIPVPASASPRSKPPPGQERWIYTRASICKSESKSLARSRTLVYTRASIRYLSPRSCRFEGQERWIYTPCQHLADQIQPARRASGSER